MNDVVIAGLKVRPSSYARAVSSDIEQADAETASISTKDQVTAFFYSKGINFEPETVEACHLLPRRDNTTGKRVINMRFVNRKHKTALLKEGKKFKGTNVYVNKNLTKQRSQKY